MLNDLLWNAHSKLYNVLHRKPKPWDARTQEIFEEFEPQGKIDRFLYRGLARVQWKAEHKPSKLSKVRNTFWNDWLLAAGYQGALYEEAARHHEKLTGRSAEWATAKNALYWTPISLATEHLLANRGSKKIGDLTDHSLLLQLPTILYATAFTGFNYFYRYPEAKKGNIVMNIGPAGLYFNIKEMFHHNTDLLYDAYSLRAKQDGTSLLYAVGKTTYEEVRTAGKTTLDVVVATIKKHT